jgi:cysteine desulfurase
MQATDRKPRLIRSDMSAANAIRPMTPPIYFDHNATTPLDPVVFEAMAPYLRETFGNPSSLHAFGREARAAIDDAREQVAGLIGAGPEEIVFTSGGTEADNLAARGALSAADPSRRRVITSSIEHHAVLHTCQFLETVGHPVTYLPVDGAGLVDPEALRETIADDVALVSVMHANNEVGTVQPIRELSRIAHEMGALFHTDAVQTVGRMPVDIEDLGADLLSLSGHKFYGPKGIGALYVRAGTPLASLQHGGPHEGNLRGGTEHVAGIVGLGAATELAAERLADDAIAVASLRNRLEEGLLARIEEIQVLAQGVPRVPGTAAVVFARVEGESIVIGLDLEGVAVSTGSACTSESLEPSHVMVALELPREWAQGMVRFSLGRENTAAEVDRALGAIGEVIGRLRAVSAL